MTIFMEQLEQNKYLIGVIYLLVMNLAGMAVMWSDKQRAKKHAWRIPEKNLFLVSLAGGSVGTLIGMYLFHHKTKHWYFVFGMPAILVIQIMIGCYLFVIFNKT